MRIALFFLFSFLFILLLNTTPPQVTAAEECWELEEWVIEEFTCPPQSIDTVALLLDAMIEVESRGNDSAYAANENAAGCLQIRPIMVKEVNRFLRKLGDTLRYDLDDRWCREKSIEMFYVWVDYRHDDSNLETIARSWNGGPRGPKKKSTLYYWSKVQNEYKFTDDEMDS